MSDEPPTFEQLHAKYVELLTMVRDTTRHDPRSCDLAMTRLEESLFWASKGAKNGNDNER